MADKDLSPIVFYCYQEFSDMDYFISALKRRFAERHEREIDIRLWDCYSVEPGRDGDMYAYDGIALTALVDKGYFHKLPDIIDTSDFFPWALNCTRVRGSLYAVPILGCCNSIICRERDYKGFSNIFDLDGKAAVPLKSLVNYYYIQSFCNTQNREKSVEAIRLLKDRLCAVDFETSRLADNDTLVALFNSGECPYFIGFTENIRFFDKDSYVVKLANFSDKDENEMPFFMADFVSLGSGVKEEKLLDCLDLMEIMASAEFIEDICTENGRLQYMLPLHRSLYPVLAALEPVYNQFYEIVSNEDNCFLRYNRRFYEEFSACRDELTALL